MSKAGTKQFKNNLTNFLIIFANELFWERLMVSNFGPGSAISFLGGHAVGGVGWGQFLHPMLNWSLFHRSQEEGKARFQPRV